MKPYYQDDFVTLYHGDAIELAPMIPRADAIVTDPPYGETALEWDRWPDGWPEAMTNIAPQMWCFGSMRMFFDKSAEFASWKLAQDIVWEKHNGSNVANDRFRRVHELALHFYRGEWSALRCEVPRTGDERRKQNIRRGKTPHLGMLGDESAIEGRRIMASVIFANSCHGYAVNETQKPEAIVAPLIEYSVPPGGTVVDLFAGSGTVGACARKTGRKAILIEKRESQCIEIVKRLAQGDLLAGVA